MTAITGYTLTNSHGITVELTNLGATLMSVVAPDRNRQPGVITLAYPKPKDYRSNPAVLGSTIGRVVNRIRGGTYSYQGKTYQLDRNLDGKHQIHGGLHGFASVLWAAETITSSTGNGVRFTYLSPDGEGGYPGNLQVQVDYLLTEANELKIEYTATTDQVTPVNLTNHAYWNLTGRENSDILAHELQLDATYYLPADQQHFPTGEILNVQNSAFDFRVPTAIGKRFKQLSNGYDHCYVLAKPRGELALAARVFEPTSGRVLEVYTDQPGIQLYTGNHLAEAPASLVARTFKPYQAFCLETQNFPDAVNQPHFLSPFLAPHTTYRHTAVYRFLVMP